MRHKKRQVLKCHHSWQEVRQTLKGNEIELCLTCGKCKTKIIELYRLYRAFEMDRTEKRVKVFEEKTGGHHEHKPK